MKICTVVGARPQFIKAAALSRVIREKHQEILIHTGQHYDYNMSNVFFEELNIPIPDYNLGISGGTHGKMTGAMLGSIEQVLIDESPDMLLVYGDTNSTLAGALAAVKLHIPVCHVEAGIRMGTLLNPEEVNRILVDRISSLLFCCTSVGVSNLEHEGIFYHVYNTGDLMFDALLYYGQKMKPLSNLDITDLEGNPISIPDIYYLLTCHREENTGTDNALIEIFSSLEEEANYTVYPVHPRNRKRVEKLVNSRFKKIILIQPVGYLTSLYLIKNAKKIITDSGGLQREAWFYDRPCITLLDRPVWPETLDGNMNQLCPADQKELSKRLSTVPNFSQKGNAFGDGNAAQKMVDILSGYERGDMPCNLLT